MKYSNENVQHEHFSSQILIFFAQPKRSSLYQMGVLKAVRNFTNGLLHFLAALGDFACSRKKPFIL